MSFKLINQVIRVWERVNSDPRSKIAKIIFTTGVAMLAGGGISLNGDFQYTSAAGETFKFAGNANDIPLYLLLFGGLFTIVGFAMLVHRYWCIQKESAVKNVALFLIPGFENLNRTPPFYGLPVAEQKKAKEIILKTIPSYKVETIVEEYPHIERQIRHRGEHAGIDKPYVASLGSVPFIYLMGCIFRNGHLPLRVMEHDRSIDKWKLLDDVGPEKKLCYKYDSLNGTAALAGVAANSSAEIGLSISFTNDVLTHELPLPMQKHTMDIKLEGATGFDAVPTDPVQDELVKQIAHVMTTLTKKANRVHIFIAAQASIVFKLGKLYQDNMSGDVVIHNYDPRNKHYNWAVDFDGKKPSVHVP
jgi:hypothetical protein